jgi:hypothetical protein
MLRRGSLSAGQATTVTAMIGESPESSASAWLRRMMACPVGRRETMNNIFANGPLRMLCVDAARCPERPDRGDQRGDATPATRRHGTLASGCGTVGCAPQRRRKVKRCRTRPMIRTPAGSTTLSSSRRAPAHNRYTPGAPPPPATSRSPPCGFLTGPSARSYSRLSHGATTERHEKATSTPQAPAPDTEESPATPRTHVPGSSRNDNSVSY